MCLRHAGAQIRQEMRNSVWILLAILYLDSECGFFHYREAVGAVNPGPRNPNDLAQLAGKMDSQSLAPPSIKSQVRMAHLLIVELPSAQNDNNTETRSDIRNHYWWKWWDSSSKKKPKHWKLDWSSVHKCRSVNTSSRSRTPLRFLFCTLSAHTSSCSSSPPEMHILQLHRVPGRRQK